MDEVIELATKLSRAISRSSRFGALRTAEAAVVADEEAVKNVQRRDELLRALTKKEQSGEPIEVEEKRELAEIDEFVKTHALLADLGKAQADFQEMLNLVNQQIMAALTPPETEEKTAPAE